VALLLKGGYLFRKSSEGLGTAASSALDLAHLAGQPSNPKLLPPVWPLFAQIVLDFGAGALLLGTVVILAKRVDATWRIPGTQIFLAGAGLASVGLLLRRITSPGPTDRQPNKGPAGLVGGSSSDAVIMLQVFLLAAGLGSAGWLLSHFSPPEPIHHTPNIAEIKVTRQGAITLNGEPVTIDALKTHLSKLSQFPGSGVWYYREDLASEPHSNALLVIQAISNSGLPLRISSKADFSDYMDTDGKSHPTR
jgi:biopolymer transport protein ExbD